jgi:disulfide bond formation protein DsbB
VAIGADERYAVAAVLALRKGHTSAARGDMIDTADRTMAAERAGVARNRPRSLLVLVAWIQAVVAMAGSLYFSDVMLMPPCVLCWYQRICMYPLVAVLGVGFLLRERRIHFYVLPLSLIGLGIALYHKLLYYGIIAESIVPCTTGISCTARNIEWFGFITIPLLSLTAFSVISAAMIAHATQGAAGED